MVPDPIDVDAERDRLARGPDLPGSPLNSAGSALPTRSVYQATVDHLMLEAKIGGYEAAAAARPRLEAVYGAAARLIGADSDDIALVESATVGWQRLVEAMRLGPGDRVVATRLTYVSSALQLIELERCGVELEILPETDGGLDLATLEKALAKGASLLVGTHVATSSGRPEPVVKMGRLARAAGVPFLLDATQSVGQLPTGVAAIGCDALVTTGRKFLRAPRGTGFLYVSPRFRATLRPTAPDVRGATWSEDRDFELAETARRFETWEASHALRLGLGVALEEAASLGVERISRHLLDLAGLLRRRLDEVPGITVCEPLDAGSAIVTFVREGESPQQTQQTLASHDRQVVVVPASHGYWDLRPRGLDAVVRASVHVYNGPDDVDSVIECLERNPPATDLAAARPLRALAKSVDAVVVGAGIHGRSAAWSLARRGRSVVLLEASRLGHRNGSSHGATRIIRRAYPDEVWDGLIDLAYAGWRDVETSAAATLLTTTGGIFAGTRGENGVLRGPGCEEIGVAEARRIAPGLRLGDDMAVVHDPAAGVIDAAGAMRSLLDLAVRSGVEVRDAAPLQSWEEEDERVIVDTARGTISAANLVICAGPWIGWLVPEIADLLRVVRIVNLHLPVGIPDLAPPGLCAFGVEVAGQGLFYGVPEIGGRGAKVGFDDGPADDLRTPPPPPTEAELELLLDFAREHLAVGEPTVAESLVCRYTMAPGSRFAVGRIPGRRRVLVAAACSGHGFKFAPAIGEALADLALEIERPDLEFIDPTALAAVA